MTRPRLYLASFLCSLGIVGTVVLLYLIMYHFDRLATGYYGFWSDLSIFMLLATTLAILLSCSFAGPVYVLQKKQKMAALLMLLSTVAFVFAETLVILGRFSYPG